MNWIALRDRRPEMDRAVLISDGKFAAVAALRPIGSDDTYWDGHGFGGYEWEWDFVPTHWAELPELPPAPIGPCARLVATINGRPAYCDLPSGHDGRCSYTVIVPMNPQMELSRAYRDLADNLALTAFPVLRVPSVSHPKTKDDASD